MERCPNKWICFSVCTWSRKPVEIVTCSADKKYSTEDAHCNPTCHLATCPPLRLPIDLLPTCHAPVISPSIIHPSSIHQHRFWTVFPSGLCSGRKWLLGPGWHFCKAPWPMPSSLRNLQVWQEGGHAGCSKPALRGAVPDTSAWCDSGRSPSRIKAPLTSAMRLGSYSQSRAPHPEERPVFTKVVSLPSKWPPVVMVKRAGHKLMRGKVA